LEAGPVGHNRGAHDHPDADAPGTHAAPPTDDDETSLAVVMFEDIEASTALKRTLTRRGDESTFQQVRKEHDAVVARIVARDGLGQIVKWTGDGFIAVFKAPSVAVERAIEIQEAMHEHPQVKVRIGIDAGEVRLGRDASGNVDVFGAHVDWAARTMSLADGGHICVTAPVHRDAFAWITKRRIAWKRHGLYRVKAVEPPLEVFQPYNANHHRPMRKLRGEKVEEVSAKPAKAEPVPPPVAAVPDEDLQMIRPWEAVARDGRDFAEKGAGTMYWFKVPLGGLSYPEGFRHFLAPALDNPRIGKIRFVLDQSVGHLWKKLVLPLLKDWAEGTGQPYDLKDDGDGGSLTTDAGGGTRLGWVIVDLSREFTPCFKLFVDDPDRPDPAEHSAQIFLSTAQRMVRFADGTHDTIRIPDAVLRVRGGRHEPLLHALNAVANQWDSLFW
jgi:class 3 adenylate cyclase